MSKKVGDVATTTSFTSENAPCGRVVDGVRYRDTDEDGLRVEHMHYACGCRLYRRRCSTTEASLAAVVHHNGKVLVHEEFRGE